jgi:hypothetical protein
MGRWGGEGLVEGKGMGKGRDRGGGGITDQRCLV